jgi:isochorismate synthase
MRENGPDRAAATSPLAPAVLATIGEALAAAERGAARSEAPRFARFSLSLPAAPSLGALLADPRLPPLAFVWREPARGRSFVALGAVGERGVDSSERDARCSRLLEQLEPTTPLAPRGGLGSTAAPEWEPVLGVASSFDGRAGAGAWAGWPAATVVLPALAVVVDGARVSAVAHVLVSVNGADGPTAPPHVQGAQVAEQLARVLALAERAARRGEGRRAGTARLAPLRLADPAARGAYEARVEAARGALGPSLDKLVVARASRLAPPPGATFELASVIERLSAREPGGFVFALPGADGQAFVGATPELLVERRGPVLGTVALAGTRARSGDDARDARLLLASDKDLHEQALVTADIEARLGALAGGAPVERAGPEVRLTRRVLHLETRLRVRAPGVALTDAARALHPTPAVAGRPHDAARAWLAAHEALDRGYYAGPIGVLELSGDGCFAVALRSALVGPRGATAFVGAGIVPASVPSDEWVETEHKLEVVDDALSVARPEPRESAAPRDLEELGA